MTYNHSLLNVTRLLFIGLGRRVCLQQQGLPGLPMGMAWTAEIRPETSDRLPLASRTRTHPTSTRVPLRYTFPRHIERIQHCS